MREFLNTARTGKVRIWRIAVDGNQVITEFGEQDGVLQRVTDTAPEKNVGRKNYVSGEESARQQMERQILLKVREGYREVGTGSRDDTFDFSRPLPSNLCFYKPDNTLSATLAQKLRSGAALLSRKRDGEMMVVVKDAGGKGHIYSRRMLPHHDKETLPWGVRFQYLLDELESRDDIPSGTIFLGEMVGTPADDQRWHVAGVIKSKTGRAIDLMAEKGQLYYYVWDIAYFGGQDMLQSFPVEDRIELNHLLFDNRGGWFLPLEVYPPDLSGDPVENALALAKRLDYEGWVVLDPKGVFGDKAFNFRGKTDRPGAYSGKLKPEYEDDFIALFDPDSGIGKWGRGKYQNAVGSVELHQYTANGDLVYICDCGNGISEEFREQYSDPKSYPLVLKVLYTTRTYVSDGDNTNALQFPRVLEVRDDKTVDECVNPRL